MAEYYSITADKSLELLRASKKGLSNTEARQRLAKYGLNKLKKEKRISILGLFLDQFKNALILLLVFAGGLSLFLGETIEAGAIFFIIFLNTILGFIQEYRAEKELEELEKLSAPTAKILRDGEINVIDARNIVPGDILLLESGDIVAADARLIEVENLQIDEAALTGESVPSKKVMGPFKPGTHVADQENMAFMGTVVTYGRASVVVTTTGMNTEFGKIAASLQKTEAAKTPLQIKFTYLAKQISFIAIALIAIVFTAGFLQGTMSFSRLLLFALVLTVSTIPNSLPLVVTVGLSVGAKKLAKQNMLIKKLPAAESLGAATIICSDKTGTITKNQMTVTDLYFNNQHIKVSGSGYNPEGKFLIGDRIIDAKKLELFLRIGYLCNNAKLVKKGGKFRIIGDPTEGSLVVLGRKGGLNKTSLDQFDFIDELPFDADRKQMTVIFRNKTNKKIEAYVKGAPDMLLNKCSRVYENGRVRKITCKDKERILHINDAFANNALRVLGLAYRQIRGIKKCLIENVEKDLVFVGLSGMIDPPRIDIKESVKECKKAGIDIMIITGDHALTTKAIATQVGLFKKGDAMLTGEELDRMSDKMLRSKIGQIRIIARVLPIQKLRIVNLLQKKGHVVAMTGDGVNDAPALKKADIGIAMGITGTDVAKEVSDAILIDDNFSTIVNAISIGRNIYDKMIKSAKYLLSCNAGEIIAVLTAVLLKFPLPLLPLQILLMNLLTDDFPALGLGLENEEKDIMTRPPRDPKESPITNKILILVVLFGLIMGLGTFLVFALYQGTDLRKAQTVAFTALVMIQMFAVVSSRSLRFSWKKINPFTNLWLSGAICLSLLIQVSVIYWSPFQLVFSTAPLGLVDWLRILGVAAVGFMIMEISKLVIKPKMHI